MFNIAIVFINTRANAPYQTGSFLHIPFPASHATNMGASRFVRKIVVS